VNSYSFWQLCRPRGDFRIKETIEFFNLMRKAFRFPVLYDRNDKPVEITAPVLQDIFRKETSKHFPKIGATVHFFSIPPKNRDDNTVRFEIHTGTHPDETFIDSYDISIGAEPKVPDLSYFQRSIEIFRPFEAYVSEFRNDADLNWYEREQAIPNFDKPALIRGFHYLDKGMAASIGGIDHCLKAPGWKIETFCEGILIQLAPGLFDPTNTEHLKIQQQAMKYFKML
jgi:hypothetical protein